MGAVNSKIDDIYYSKERYITPETKYDLQTLKRSTFPLRVSIYSSSCRGLTQDCAYQDVDVYFAKHTRMLVAVSSREGVPRLIPLNCDIECCVIDNFDQNLEKCLEGRTFNGVKQLMSANPLPKVVYAEQGFYENDYSFSVEMGDVLIVEKLEKRDGETVLKCYESCSYRLRILRQTMKATFTTKAAVVGVSPLCLHDCSVQLPARILVKSGNPVLNDTIHTVTNFVTKKSVVASLRYAESASAGGAGLGQRNQSSSVLLSEMKLFEVYLDSPVEFEIIKLTNLEMQKLRVKADEISRQYSSSKMDRIIVNPSDKVQSLFMHTIKEGIEFGVETQLPEPSYSTEFPDFLMKHEDHDSAPNTTSSYKIQLQKSKTLLTKIESDIQRSHSAKPVRKTSSVNYGKLLSGVWSPKTLGHSSDDMTNLSFDERPPLFKTGSDDGDYVDMDGETQQWTPTLSRKDLTAHGRTDSPLTLHQDQPTRKLVHKPSAVDRSPSYGQRNNDSPSVRQRNRTAEENKNILSRYSVKQVIGLLHQLGLAEYKTAFEKEIITGSLLLELDDSTLTELGMSKKLHRIKLLRVIDGRESIKKLNTTAVVSHRMETML